jgi:hypothetical protein
MVGFAFFLLSAWMPFALAQTHLQYQNRGNRFEGIKPKPVAGYDIELISARVDYKEEVVQMPDRFTAKFYLKEPSEVHLTVRELDYKYYYWLDKVRPSEAWRQGFDNVFAWPTQDVIRQLDEIKMYDLGVVARLMKPEPSQVERVAPVIFYHSKLPAAITGYLFTFKTNSDARLTCSVYKEGEATPVFTSIIPRQRGGRPFTLRWDSLQAKAGSYKLVLKGYFLDTNDTIEQIVYFYHQPVVK